MLPAAPHLPIQLEEKRARTNGGTRRVWDLIRGSSSTDLIGVVLLGFGRRDGIPSYVAGAEVGRVHNPSPGAEARVCKPSIPLCTYSYTYSHTHLSTPPKPEIP